MINFTAQESQAIQAWLNGTKDYYTVTEIVVSTHDFNFQDDYNLTRDYNILSTYDSSSGTSYEHFEVDNVRYKAHGLGPDMKFRAPSLSFIWKNFRGVSEVYRQKCRFYLCIRLLTTVQVPDNLSTGIVLLRTDWYRIKSFDYLSKTSSLSGSDAQIEAIPWIYQYNEKMPWGPTTALSQVQVPTAYSDDYSYNIEPSIPFWDTISAIMVRSKLLHDRRIIAEQDYTARTYSLNPDAPCPFSGPFIRKVSGGIASYLNSLPSSSTVPNTYRDLYLNSMMLLTDNVEATPLSLLSWKALSTAWVIGPGIYGAFNNSPLLDTPSVTLTPLSVFKDSPLYYSGLHDFQDIEDPEKDLEIPIDYKYECESGYVLNSISEYGKSSVMNFSPAVTGLVEIPGWNAIPSDSQGQERQNWVAITRTIWFSTSSSGQHYRGSMVTPNGGSFFYFPGEITPNSLTNITVSTYYLGEKSPQKKYLGSGKIPIKIDLHGAQRLERCTSTANVVDVNTRDSWEFAMHPYLLFKMLIEFSSEWRPWINIYDTVTIRYQDGFAQSIVTTAVVFSINADADSFTATYNCGVISKKTAFSINGVEYYSDYGLTWEQWVATPDNTGGFYVATDSDFVFTSDGYIISNVLKSDTILSEEYTAGVLQAFSVDGVAYLKTAQMTWRQWVDSEYNVDGFIISAGFVRYRGNKVYEVSPSDIIATSGVYRTYFDFYIVQGGNQIAFTGQTWKDWLESELNVNSYYYSTRSSDIGAVWTMDSSRVVDNVTYTDLIIRDRYYDLVTQSGGADPLLNHMVTFNRRLETGVMQATLNFRTNSLSTYCTSILADIGESSGSMRYYSSTDSRWVQAYTHPDVWLSGYDSIVIFSNYSNMTSNPHLFLAWLRRNSTGV